MTTKARKILRRALSQADEGIALVDEAFTQQAKRDAVIAVHRARQSAEIIPFQRRKK